MLRHVVDNKTQTHVCLQRQVHVEQSCSQCKEIAHRTRQNMWISDERSIRSNVSAVPEVFSVEPLSK